MANDNAHKFRNAYIIRLRKAVEAHPEHYSWGANDTVEIVVDRMMEAIKKSGFAMSLTLKAAAKDCGVSPQTYQNVKDYVLGKLNPINDG